MNGLKTENGNETLSSSVRSHFKSLIGRERLRNAQKRKTHVQSVQNYCFSLSVMQICDVHVAVVVT